MNMLSKSKYIVMFILIYISNGLYSQNDSLIKALRLCNEKKYQEVIPIINQVIHSTETKYEPQSWHTRSYTYLMEYKRLKIINKSRLNLLDSAMVSAVSSIKLDSSKSFFENNSAFLKNGTSLFYKACSVFLNDSLDFTMAEQCYLKFRKYSSFLYSDFDYKANDIVFYNAVGSVFSDLYLKNTSNSAFLNLAKKSILKVFEFDNKNVIATINFDIISTNRKDIHLVYSPLNEELIKSSANSLADEIKAIKGKLLQKEKEIEKKDDQLKEQALQNQVLEKEKQIKELLLAHHKQTLKANETEAFKKEYEIATLNKDRRIKEIEIKNQKTDNEKKEQELKLNVEQKKFQDAELKQQKFTKNLISVGLAAVVIFLVIVFISLQKNKKASKIISLQKQEVENQKRLVEEKHQEITDSINYAERIQRSFLATKEQLDEQLKDYFVLFQPKDVVSGDFYWAHTLNNGNFALVTADSTGHGVPGAIMSLLNTSSLEKAIELGINEPAEILNHTRQTIIQRLKRDGSAEGGKDGMDCSLISFNKDKTKLTYAAANNPIWIIRNNELIELSPDKIPVGKHDRDSISFTQHEIELQKGDMIYTLTDGFPDQFGGPKGKKFMYKKLKELLISIAHNPTAEQQTVLKDTLKVWKGNTEQVDDITLIGIRVRF